MYHELKSSNNFQKRIISFPSEFPKYSTVGKEWNLLWEFTLINAIINEYKNSCDGFYLFGDLGAVDFYKKLGFKTINQYTCKIKDEIIANVLPHSFTRINNKNSRTDLTREFYVITMEYVDY